MRNRPVPTPRPPFSVESSVASPMYCRCRFAVVTTPLATPDTPVAMPRLVAVSEPSVPAIRSVPPPPETSVMEKPVPLLLRLIRRRAVGPPAFEAFSIAVNISRMLMSCVSTVLNAVPSLAMKNSVPSPPNPCPPLMPESIVVFSPARMRRPFTVVAGEPAAMPRSAAVEYPFSTTVMGLVPVLSLTTIRPFVASMEAVTSDTPAAVRASLIRVITPPTVVTAPCVRVSTGSPPPSGGMFWYTSPMFTRTDCGVVPPSSMMKLNAPSPTALLICTPRPSLSDASEVFALSP